MNVTVKNLSFCAVAALLLTMSHTKETYSAACSAVPGLTEVTQLKWPGLQIPAGSATYAVSGTGGADAGTGTKLYGTSARGQYTVTKASGSENNCATITINIQSANCNAAGCSLGTWTGVYNGTTLSGSPPWSGLAMPATGKTLYLGATSTYDGTVTAGAKVPGFNIVINYDAEPTTSFSRTAAINFDPVVTIGNVTNINFGTVKAMASGTYTLNTTGVITAGGGGQSYSGSGTPGQMTIYGSGNQTVNVSAGSFVAGGSGGGVTLSNPTCSYNSGAEGSCTINGAAAPTASGKILKIGIKATVDANQPGGSTASPSFTVTVVYS